MLQNLVFIAPENLPTMTYPPFSLAVKARAGCCGKMPVHQRRMLVKMKRLKSGGSWKTKPEILVVYTPQVVCFTLQKRGLTMGLTANE